jgi:hypothetical protein
MGSPAELGAPRATGVPAAEFMLSALVTAELAATYDAGALVLWAGERSWATLLAAGPVLRAGAGRRGGGRLPGPVPDRPGCTIAFERIAYVPERLEDLRGGG